MAEESLKDHRDIGQQLDLFSFHDIAPGAPFWHPHGMILFKELEKIVRAMNDEDRHQEISTPILVRKELFEKSGHWDHYRQNMFYFENPREEKEILIAKPMNCPESTYVFNARIRSYRDLPLRLAEIGRLNRNELSGTLGGLFRVRQITMDDAHIYARPDQTREEIVKIVERLDTFYRMFNFSTSYVLATRPDKGFLGTEEEWHMAEEALEDALKKAGVDYTVAKGEGAFYGPKIEAHLKDSQGRDWQMGTAQLDLVMLPKQFDVAYTDEDGSRKTPWVIHRAILGSFERFIGVLLEHTSGNLPLWLSPVQAAVITVSDKQQAFAQSVVHSLRHTGIRAELHDQNETLGKKIRNAEMQKIPYLLIVGDKEVEAKTVAVRKRGTGDVGAMTVDTLVAQLKEEVDLKK